MTAVSIYSAKNLNRMPLARRFTCYLLSTPGHILICLGCQKVVRYRYLGVPDLGIIDVWSFWSSSYLGKMKKPPVDVMLVIGGGGIAARRPYNWAVLMSCCNGLPRSCASNMSQFDLSRRLSMACTDHSLRYGSWFILTKSSRVAIQNASGCVRWRQFYLNWCTKWGYGAIACR